MKDLTSLLKDNVDSIYPSPQALENQLKSAKKLRVYLGVDPSSPEIHLGHTILLEKLRLFQDLGHEVILLVGDFTGMIGDPTGKDKTRIPLTRNQVLENSKTYQKQASKILSFSGRKAAKIKYNSAWLDKVNFKDLIELASQLTVQQMLERDMFQARLEQNRPISLHEFFYPLMQGYDSVAMKVDLEIGGTDQTFNMLVGRQLVKTYLKKEKFVLTTHLLPGLDGKKMSKSAGNIVPVDSGANDIFGKIMSLRDDLIVEYLNRLTNESEKQIQKVAAQLNLKAVNPMDLKLKLAATLTEKYYGKRQALEAQNEFDRVFRQKQAPSTTPETTLDLPGGPLSVLELIKLTKLAPSNSAALRLIEQGGVEIDNKPHRLPLENLQIKGHQTFLKVGKRGFLLVRWRKIK
ncbi:MAG: tyrosine--tRNA ligase [bacterium]|nr:tyrosine--tRNA ligase [bacterium]